MMKMNFAVIKTCIYFEKMDSQMNKNYQQYNDKEGTYCGGSTTQTFGA